MDDLPPLEDLSHLMRNSSRSINQPPQKIVPNSSNSDSRLKLEPSDKMMGFKKGFLLSTESTKKNSKENLTINSKDSLKNSKNSTIPYIKPGPRNSLVIDSVQDAILQNQSLIDKKEWLNDEFLAKIESNPILKKAMNDPLFATAAEQVAKDPKCIQKWKEYNPLFVEALQEFSGLMAESFDKLHETQLEESFIIPDELPTHEKDLITAVLGNPNIKNILSKPEIQRILNGIKSNPKSLALIMTSASNQQVKDLDELIKIGLLSVQ